MQLHLHLYIVLNYTKKSNEKFSKEKKTFMHALHVLLILMFKIFYILLNILERKSEMDKRHTENLAKELSEVRSAHLEDQQRMHDGKIHYIP